MKRKLLGKFFHGYCKFCNSMAGLNPLVCERVSAIRNNNRDNTMSVYMHNLSLIFMTNIIDIK